MGAFPYTGILSQVMQKNQADGQKNRKKRAGFSQKYTSPPKKNISVKITKFTIEIFRPFVYNCFIAVPSTRLQREEGKSPSERRIIHHVHC